MTKEEAKRRIKKLFRWYLKEEPMSETMYMREAVNMAIKALSEPTIPLSAIEKIKAEIRHKQWYLGVDNANQIIGIIDDAVKEVNNNV